MEKEMHPEEGLNIGEHSIIVSRERKQLEIWHLDAEKEGEHIRVATEEISPDMIAIEGIENALMTLISMVTISEAWNKD